MTDTMDLVETLAAADAVRARREAILSGARSLRGIAVKLELANGGDMLGIVREVSA